MRSLTRAVRITAVSALVLCSGACADQRPPASSGHEPTATTSRAVMPEFVRLLRDYAKHCGDSSPTDVRYVRTTRGLADRLVNDTRSVVAGRSDGDPVVVVEARGRFRDKVAPVPIGKPAPSGSVIAITVDHGAISDYSLSDHYRDLAPLGVPVVVS